MYENNPILSIKDIVDIKENNKTLDDIIKCKANEPLLKLGESCVESIESVDGSDNDAKTYKRLTYEDKKHKIIVDSFWKTGTLYPWRVKYQEFDDEGNIIKDEIYKYKAGHDPYFDTASLNSLDDGGKYHFKGQKDKIIDKYGEEGWEFWQEYRDVIGSNTLIPPKNKYLPGDIINDYASGKISKETAIERFDGHRNCDFALDNVDRFDDILSSMNVGDYGDVLTFSREKVEDVDISKKIVRNDGFTRSSCGSDYRDVNQMNGIETDYNNPIECYDILTLYDSGNTDGKGAYVSPVVNDGKSPYTVGNYMGKEIISPKGQKFERVLIDLERKFILQLPH